MKVSFRIKHHTKEDQQVYLCGSIKAFGEWDSRFAYPMILLGDNEWEAFVNFKHNKKFSYKYFVKDQKGDDTWEGGTKRSFSFPEAKTLVIRDCWHKDNNPDYLFENKVFTNALMPGTFNKETEARPQAKTSILFRIHAPRVASGYSMAILGDNESLGNWESPVLMNRESSFFWTKEISADEIQFPLYYKYVLFDKKRHTIAEWEEGAERTIFSIDQSSEPLIHIQNDVEFRYASEPWRATGVSVELPALRSNNGFGIGEISDLKILVDWCQKTGLRLIDLNPLNDSETTKSLFDSYPQKIISVHALNPVFINLDKTGTLKSERLSDEFELTKEMLNSRSQLAYKEVLQLKLRYLHLIFLEEWKELSNDSSYKLFWNNNKEWLMPYAAFCFLREHYNTICFEEWGAWSNYRADKVLKLVDPKGKNHHQIAFYYFIQYHLYQQAQELADYAREKHVALKCNLPPGINRYSVETWMHPEYFKLKFQTGMPANDLSATGENWGFPPYNWDKMAEDNYSWWKKRFKSLSLHFDACTLNNVETYASNWQIPNDAIHSELGTFHPSLAFTPDEFENYKLLFDHDRFTKPYIRKHLLHDFFGEHTEEVEKLYLRQINASEYVVNDGFDTQKKIYEHFTPVENSKIKINEKNVIIRDGLMALLDEVLFIKDPETGYETYHPRYKMQDSYSFRELPSDTKGKLQVLYTEFYTYRNKERWESNARKKLRTIKNSSVLMLLADNSEKWPVETENVLKILNIPGIENLRIPHDEKSAFESAEEFSYQSVCTTGTFLLPDFTTWWRKNGEKARLFYNLVLKENGKAPAKADSWIFRKVIKKYLQSSSIWAIFPIQDILAMDEDLSKRGNFGINSKTKNRMNVRLEELLLVPEFNGYFHHLIRAVKRDSN